MANTNNFSLTGVGSNVRFGKGGGRLQFSNGGFQAFLTDGVTLSNLSIDTPVDNAHAATKLYVDQAIGTAISTGINVAPQGLSYVNGTIALVLDGTTLSKSGTGLKVNVGGITNTEINGTANIAVSKLASLGSNNVIVVTDGSGKLASSSITTTSLSYLDATSSIQGQLNAITTVDGTQNTRITNLESGKLNITGGTVSGPIVYASSPVGSSELVNKAYVDSSIQTASTGLDSKQAVKAATTANISLTGSVSTIDAVTITDGDRVLVKNQSNPVQNGIYIANTAGWTRSSDMDEPQEVSSAYVFVEQGGQAGKGFVVVGFVNGDVIGVADINWTQFSQAGAYTAGNGLTLNAGQFALANAVTAGTYNQVTVDATGRVVAGSAIPYLTANQTIILSGDVSGTGGTSIVTTIGTNTVQYSKIQRASGQSLIGAQTAGDLGEITLGSGLTMTGGTISATASGSGLIPYISGAGTASNGGQATALAIGNGAVNDVTTGTGAIAIGHGANTSSFFGIAIGSGASAIGNSNGIAIGRGAFSGGDRTIIIGDGTSSVGGQVILGFAGKQLTIDGTTGNVSANNLSGTNTGDLTINGTTTTALTLSGLTLTSGTLAVSAATLIPYIKGAGTATNAGGTAGLAIGNNATVDGLSGIAIGPGASAGGSKSITIGDNTAANSNEIVIGFGTNTINVSTSGDISAKNLSGTNTGDVTFNGTLAQAVVLGTNLAYDGTNLNVVGLGTLGTGSVTSIVAGNGLSGGTINTAGTIALNIASLGTASSVGTSDIVAISQNGVTVRTTVNEIIRLVSIAAPPATALYKEFYSANLTTSSQELGTAPDLYAGIGGKVVVPSRVYFRVTSPFADGTTALAKVVFTASNNAEQIVMTFDENDLSENGQYVVEAPLGAAINGQVASIQFFEADGTTPAIPTQGDGIVKIAYDVIDNINNGSA